jgi:hypothetical protein
LAVAGIWAAHPFGGVEAPPCVLAFSEAVAAIEKLRLGHETRGAKYGGRYEKDQFQFQEHLHVRL